MKFLIPSILFMSVFTGFENRANAQMLSPEIKVEIQSVNDVISYSQLEASCTKNDPNQMELNFIGEVTISRTNSNLYELTIAPIKLNTPVLERIIKCHVTLFIYLESKKYLRFLITGSDEEMTIQELKMMVESRRVLGETLERKLNHAELVRANVPQGYVLNLSN